MVLNDSFFSFKKSQIIKVLQGVYRYHREDFTINNFGRFLGLFNEYTHNALNVYLVSQTFFLFYAFKLFFVCLLNNYR